LYSNHPALGAVAAMGDNWRMFTLAYISAAITKYLDFIGRRNTMNDSQVAETAQLILEEYQRLKFDDIEFFFRNCRLSKYGKLYDINGQVLLDWLHEYDMQRWAAEERKARHDKEEEERRRIAEWEALPQEEKDRQLREIQEIQDRITKRLK